MDKATARGSSIAILPPGAFRLVLAVVVMLSHVSRYDLGRLAVMLFFFLSGYWVSRNYLGEFGGRRSLAFYASRWLRIAPLYFLVLVPAILYTGQTIGPETILLLGVDTMGHDPLGVSWSLDIELQFYLLLPALLMLSRGVLLPLTALLTGVGWFLHFRWGVNTAFMYLPAFTLGLLANEARWAPGPKLALASAAAFGLFTLAAAAIPYTHPFIDKTIPDPFDHDIFAMIWMLPLLPYVAQSLTSKSSAFDRDVGNWSYPLYLAHSLVISMFETHHLSKWAGVATACVVALALFYGFDQFVERGRKRLLAGLWAAKPAKAT
jgi:peptidoglycan/LPS O-acetylase OafA/YrhL